MYNGLSQVYCIIPVGIINKLKTVRVKPGEWNVSVVVKIPGCTLRMLKVSIADLCPFSYLD